MTPVVVETDSAIIAISPDCPLLAGMRIWVVGAVGMSTGPEGENRAIAPELPELVSVLVLIVEAGELNTTPVRVAIFTVPLMLMPELMMEPLLENAPLGAEINTLPE